MISSGFQRRFRPRELIKHRGLSGRKGTRYSSSIGNQAALVLDSITTSCMPTTCIGQAVNACLAFVYASMALLSKGEMAPTPEIQLLYDVIAALGRHQQNKSFSCQRCNIWDVHPSKWIVVSGSIVWRICSFNVERWFITSMLQSGSVEHSARPI